MAMNLRQIGLALLVAVMLFLPGCAVTMTEAEASISVNIGVIEAEASAKWEKTEDEENGGVHPIRDWVAFNVFGEPMSLSRMANNAYLTLGANNATIPNQSTTVTLVVKYNDSLLSAETFNATVFNGELKPSNPSEIQQWLEGFEHLDHGEIEFVANNLSIQEPEVGHYQVSNTLKLGSQTLASATASGYIPPNGGGCPGDCSEH